MILLLIMDMKQTALFETLGKQATNNMIVDDRMGHFCRGGVLLGKGRGTKS